VPKISSFLILSWQRTSLSAAAMEQVELVSGGSSYPIFEISQEGSGQMEAVTMLVIGLCLLSCGA